MRRDNEEYPNVINSFPEWQTLQDDSIQLFSIIETTAVGEWKGQQIKPKMSIILHTLNPMYVDFIRVAADDPHVYIESEFNTLLVMGSMYLRCLYLFTKPARMRVEFFINVEQFREELTYMAREEIIGLGFVNKYDIMKQGVDKMEYTILTLPPIPMAAIVTVCNLATVLKLCADDAICDIVETIVRMARDRQ
jgi:hypothetical protein